MALNEDFTYMLGDNGVVLNPNSVTLPFVDITKVSGLDSPDFRTTERNHEGADGNFMDAEFEKGRSVVLDGTLYADAYDVEPYLDSLKANYAPSRSLIRFYFKKPGVEERFVRVKPLGVRYDVEQLRRVGQTDIQFRMFAEDPRIYSSALITATIPQDPVVITGRGYPRSYPYSYGLPTEPVGGNVVVGGNRAAPAIITIIGPAKHPRIINESLGLEMRFDITLSDGDTLVIDTYYHSIRLNGVANRRSSLIEPNWFSLMPGNNYMRYRNADAGASTINFQYYNAWR